MNCYLGIQRVSARNKLHDCKAVCYVKLVWVSTSAHDCKGVCYVKTIWVSTFLGYFRKCWMNNNSPDNSMYLRNLILKEFNEWQSLNQAKF